MSDFVISGIQQIGIGNPNVKETWAYYRKNFGFDTPVFEEEAVAALMLPYTGGEPQKRTATLALNMNGGGGLEIWQYTDRELIWADQACLPGDLAINVLKIKTQDIEAAFKDCKKKGLEVLSDINDKNGIKSFMLRDLHSNILEIVESDVWYSKKNGLYGGVGGSGLGVSNIETSKKFYAELLGFDRVVFEDEGEFNDLSSCFDSKQRFKRVILERSSSYSGPFSPLLGAVQIELIQALDRTPIKFFENRFWGDPGYIHLCFDIVGMESLKSKSEKLGHPFTVDSANSFDMGEAAGRFSYIEDPDGTLIEFVETHKVPILKKLNIYMNLQNRKPEKSLPRWMINTLAWSRVKD